MPSTSLVMADSARQNLCAAAKKGERLLAIGKYAEIKSIASATSFRFPKAYLHLVINNRYMIPFPYSSYHNFLRRVCCLSCTAVKTRLPIK